MSDHMIDGATTILDIRTILAKAYDQGVRDMARALQGGPEPVNPYEATS